MENKEKNTKRKENEETIKKLDKKTLPYRVERLEKIQGKLVYYAEPAERVTQFTDEASSLEQ